MKVAAVSVPTFRDDVGVVTEDVGVVSQDCLFSSTEEGSVVSEKFLHERLDALSGEELETSVEVDPSSLLGLLEESNAGQYDNVEKAVERGERLLGDTDRILLLASEEDVTVLGEPPPKSVMFNIAGESFVNASTGLGSCSVANVGHSFLSSSQIDGME